MSTLNKTALAAVVGSVLFTATAGSGEAAPPTPSPSLSALTPPRLPTNEETQPDTPPSKSDELRKALEESNQRLLAIQEQLRQLAELLNGKKDDKGYPLPSDPGLVAEVRALKDRLEKLERDLAGIKTQTALRPSTTGPGSTGGSIPTPMPGPADTSVSGKGIVRVVNEYPVQVSIVVNGTSYRVAPSQAVSVEVPAGEFTYQLLEAGGNITRSSIKERETVTLRIK